MRKAGAAGILVRWSSSLCGGVSVGMRDGVSLPRVTSAKLKIYCDPPPSPPPPPTTGRLHECAVLHVRRGCLPTATPHTRPRHFPLTPPVTLYHPARHTPALRVTLLHHSTPPPRHPTPIHTSVLPRHPHTRHSAPLVSAFPWRTCRKPFLVMT